jgi:hypothetical protein
MEKYDRAVDTFDSPDLAALLTVAAEPEPPQHPGKRQQEAQQ